MALVEIKLHVIYAWLQSHWLAKNLELEPGIPGRSTHTYSSFPPPVYLGTRMRIRGKISLVLETSVRAFVYVYVLLRVCACVRVCVNVCRRGRECVCLIIYCMCVSAYIFLHALKHPLTLEHTLTHTQTCKHVRTHVVRAFLCTCVYACVCVRVFLIGCVCLCVSVCMCVRV